MYIDMYVYLGNHSVLKVLVTKCIEMRGRYHINPFCFQLFLHHSVHCSLGEKVRKMYLRMYTYVCRDNETRRLNVHFTRDKFALYLFKMRHSISN